MENGFYSIIDYAVDGPDTQQKVVEAFAAIQEQWVASYRGYRSARFLVSTDGMRAKCIVDWASEADLVHFEAVSDTKGRSAAIDKVLVELSCTAERRMFKLAREVTPAGPLCTGAPA